MMVEYDVTMMRTQIYCMYACLCVCSNRPVVSGAETHPLHILSVCALLTLLRLSPGGRLLYAYVECTSRTPVHSQFTGTRYGHRCRRRVCTIDVHWTGPNSGHANAFVIPHPIHPRIDGISKTLSGLSMDYIHIALSATRKMCRKEKGRKGTGKEEEESVRGWGHPIPPQM